MREVGSGFRADGTPHVPWGSPTCLRGIVSGLGEGRGFDDTVRAATRALGEAHICDGLLCFLFRIPCVPAGIFNLALELHEICLQLLLGVDEAGVLG